jgi:hypothetical protein
VGFPTDEALLTVFEATSLAQPMAGASSNDTGAYQELTARLNRIVDDVARRHRLQDFFRNVHNARMAFLPLDNDVAPTMRVVYWGSGSQPLGVTFGSPSFPNSGTLDYHQKFPSFPLLPLACMAVHEKVLTGSNADESEKCDIDIKMELRLCVSLCIVPVGRDFEPRAALQVSLWPEFFRFFNRPDLDENWPGEELKAYFKESYAEIYDNSSWLENEEKYVLPYGDALKPSRLPQIVREIFCADGIGDRSANLSLDISKNTRFVLVDGRCHSLLNQSLDRVRVPLERYCLPDAVMFTDAQGTEIGIHDFPGGSLAVSLDALIWQKNGNLVEQLDALAKELTDILEHERLRRKKERDDALAALDVKLSRNLDA